MAEYKQERTATVALSEAGIEDIRRCLSDTGNLEYFDIPGEEFWHLYESGVIAELNGHYGLMLDDFESGTINSDFDYLLSKFKKVEEACPTLYAAVNKAYSLETAIHFDF